MENSKPLIFLSAADERVAPLTSKNRQRDNADGSPAPKDSKSGVNLEGYVRSPARGLGVANGRPHISRIERSRRSMHAARGVSDEMLDGQVRLGGTFRHIWASGNIAISPHSNYKDLSEYRHNRSSLHPCSVRDGPRSLPHLPAGRAQPKGQSQRRSMRHFLAVAAPHHSTRNSAQRQAAKKGAFATTRTRLVCLRSRLTSTTISTPLRRRSRLRSIGCSCPLPPLVLCDPQLNKLVVLELLRSRVDGFERVVGQPPAVRVRVDRLDEGGAQAEALAVWRIDKPSLHVKKLDRSGEPRDGPARGADGHGGSVVIRRSGRRRPIGDAATIRNTVQDRGLGLWRALLGGPQESRLIVVEPEFGRLVLHISRQCGDELRAADIVAADAKFPGGKAVAALLVLRTGPAPVGQDRVRNLRSGLRRLLFLGQPGPFRDLIGVLPSGQFGPVQVFADRPHAGLDIIEVDDADADGLVVKQLEGFKSVPTGDEDIAAVASTTVGALQPDRLDRSRQVPDGVRVVRPRRRRDHDLVDPKLCASRGISFDRVVVAYHFPSPFRSRTNCLTAERSNAPRASWRPSSMSFLVAWRACGQRGGATEPGEGRLICWGFGPDRDVKKRGQRDPAAVRERRHRRLGRAHVRVALEADAIYPDHDRRRAFAAV